MPIIRFGHSFFTEANKKIEREPAVALCAPIFRGTPARDLGFSSSSDSESEASSRTFFAFPMWPFFPIVFIVFYKYFTAECLWLFVSACTLQILVHYNYLTIQSLEGNIYLYNIRNR